MRDFATREGRLDALSQLNSSEFEFPNLKIAEREFPNTGRLGRAKAKEGKGYRPNPSTVEIEGASFSTDKNRVVKR